MKSKTASMIAIIANWAINELNTHTMKSVKQNIRDRFNDYQCREGADIEEVKEAFWQSFDTKTIKEFSRRLVLLKETMENIIEELAYEKRITTAVKIANRDHGVWITREQIIKAAKGVRLFNFTKIAAECAAECKK